MVLQKIFGSKHTVLQGLMQLELDVKLFRAFKPILKLEHILDELTLVFMKKGRTHTDSIFDMISE